MPSKRRKHVPLRRCIACQRQRPKRELIRVVRTPGGSLEVDPRGKEPGRGAYVCRSHDCWQSGLDGGKLERVLHCPIAPEEIVVLRAAVASLLQSDATVQAD